MLTFTRRQAQQLRSVLRRAFGTRGSGPVIGFTGDAEGLRVRCIAADAAVEYCVPGEFPGETLWLPFDALNDFEGKQDTPVELASTETGRVTAQWRDRSGQQLTEYGSEPSRDATSFPTLPATFTENPPSFLPAFTEASEVADPNATRYALGNIRLRSEGGSLAATDGKQLLLHSGFSFPWAGDVLALRSKVLASPELPTDQPVAIGKTDNWLTFRTGPWCIHLRIDQHGRYPKIEQVIPAAETAIGFCRFSAADTKFLAETLPQLPMDAGNNHRLTLDLNGQVIIRAQADDQSKPTEVVLNGSTWSGQPLRLNVNGKQMTRATKLGLSEVRIFGKEGAVSWHDATRTYVTAQMSGDGCVKATGDAIRIESPKIDASASTSPPPKPKTERKAQPVNEPLANTNGKAASNGQARTETANGKPSHRKAKPQDLGALIEQATKLRTALHDRTHEAAELVKALKQHRRANRVIQSTLSSIRQLKGLGV